jgi:hypothetical protein
MTRLIVVLWSRLRRLLHDLSVLLLFGVVIAGAAGWLAPPPGPGPRPAAQHELDERPWHSIAVSAHVAHIWLPEPLVELAKRESRALSEQRRQQLQRILNAQDSRGVFYAFTIQIRQANGRVGNIQFLRYPVREPENVQELLDLMATAAGNPPRYRTTDYSMAVVHVVPAETSRQELFEGIKASARSRDSGLPSR